MSTAPSVGERRPARTPSPVWLRRFLLFVAAGLVATIVHGLIAWALVAHVPALAANAVGFGVAMIVTYVGNYFVAFQAEGDHRETVARFLLASVITLAVSEWILVFLEMMGADEEASILLAVVAIPLLRFGLLATRVFDRARWDAAPLRDWVVEVVTWTGAAAAGIIALLVMAPGGLLDAGSDLWLYPDGDRGVGVAGMRYYLADDWHWPLLFTDDLAAPEGTVIAFTDSIPLLALPAKLARPVIGHDVNYFPAWFLLAYTFQGLGGVALLRALKVRRPEALLCGAVLAVTFPAFVHRIFHVALEGHFIILFTLAAAFASRGDRNLRPRVLTGACMVAALLIHPYLLFMTAPLVAGIYNDHVLRKRLDLRQVMTTAVATGAALAAVLVAGGYLGTYGTADGYGQFGLNLLGPVYPQLSGIWPGDDPVLAVGGTRAEAYNWLGFGSLSLVVAAVVLERRRLGRLLSRWRSLAAAVVGVTIVSVTHLVTYGHSGLWNLNGLLWWARDHAVFVLAGAAVVIAAAAVVALRSPRVRPADRNFGLALLALLGLAGAAMLVADIQLSVLLSTVRASGRIWWSVGLLLTLGSAAIVARVPNRRLAAGLLATAAVVQVIDTQPIRAFAADAVAPTVDTPGADVLRSVMDEADGVQVRPTFFCAPYPDGVFAVLGAIVIASTAGPTPIDTAYTARPPQEEVDCEVPPAVDLTEGQVAVLVLPAKRDPGELLSPDRLCRDNGELLVCTSQWAGVPVAETAPFLPVVAEPITFGHGGDSASVLAGGWGSTDTWGQPVPATPAALSVPLIGDVGGDELTVRLRIRSVTGEAASLTVDAPGAEGQRFEVSGDDPVNVEVATTAPTGGRPLELTVASESSGALAGIDEMTVVLG